MRRGERGWLRSALERLFFVLSVLSGAAVWAWLLTLLAIAAAQRQQPGASGRQSLDELETQRARLEREHEELMANLERLEARLYRSIGTVRLWEELKARHSQASAIICQQLHEAASTRRAR